MLRAVGIDTRVGIEETQEAPDGLQVGGRAGQARPASGIAVGRDEASQLLGRVVFRVQRQRDQVGREAEARRQERAHGEEGPQAERALPLAARVREVEEHEAAADEVVIKTDGPTVVRGEHGIREGPARAPDHRIGPCPIPGGGHFCRQPPREERGGGRSEEGQSRQVHGLTPRRSGSSFACLRARRCGNAWRIGPGGPGT